MWRKMNGVSISELAKMIGVDESVVDRIERAGKLTSQYQGALTQKLLWLQIQPRVDVRPQ